MQVDEAARVRAGLEELVRVPGRDLERLSKSLLAEDTVWDVAHPLNRLNGRRQILERFLVPLRSAFDGVMRRDEMFISGKNRRSNGGDWIAAVCHYVGNFNSRFCGIEPSGRLSFLRSGEFHRISGGRIVESKVLIDLADLMRQAGSNPFPEEMGTEMLFPGPATHDGSRSA